MPYYDYRNEFNTLITNTESVINNQEIIQENQATLITGIQILVFSTVLIFTLSICRKVFRVK